MQAPCVPSEKAIKLTGAIFIPGMAANWFQQEAVVGHGQSDVRNRPGSGLRNQELGDKTVRKESLEGSDEKGNL